MAFDQDTFREAQGELLDTIQDAIKRLYVLNLNNPEFYGNLHIKHDPRGNAGDPKWELTIKRPNKGK